MTKEVFVNYVKELILPLFTGSHIAGEEPSTNRDNEVAQGSSGTMLIKAQKTDEYRLIIKRNQAFKSNEVELLKTIIVELNKINNYEIEDYVYKKRLQTLAMEKAICNSLSEVASETLSGVISELDACARRTYEGKPMSFGIVINEYQNCQNKSANLSYKNLFKKDFFSVLSNGEQSCVEIDKEGYILSHTLLEKLRYTPTIAPYDYVGVAKYCNEKRIGIVLKESGEILLFKNHELMYCKKHGVWGSYCHEEIIQLLSNRTTHTIKEIRKAIYLTALDCSFAGTGGCLVYLNKDESVNALSHIDIFDILEEDHFEEKKNQEIEEARKLYNIGKDKPIGEDVNFNDFITSNNLVKTACLRECIKGKKFHELNRKFRQEIVGVDGATIIDYDGTIIATGAIVKIEAGSSGGGRLAATKTLAKYGVAIKISADGIMQAYIKDRKTKVVKPIFFVG
ncbi:MAG: hypothetical protein IJA69_00560 [Clostridia bacterium]|nr:hypothetical protein [Clostridia bacterium]